MNSSQFTDKEILGLSSSSLSNMDFFDINSHQEKQKKQDDILASYDFHPIRSTGLGSSSSSSLAAINLETTGSAGAGPRVWNSNSKINDISGFRNYGSLDPCESANVTLEKDMGTCDTATVCEIVDRTMKKHADNLLHALDGVSAQLSQLETRTRHLESSVDDLKITIGNNHGSTDGKLRLLENMLREVQTTVQVVRDKQEISDAQLKLMMLQESKEDHLPAEKPNAPLTDSPRQTISQPQESIQMQLPPVPLPQPSQPPAVPMPNAPLPPPPEQLPPVQRQTQFPNNQNPYFPLPGQPPDAHHQQYQMPAQQPPPHQQYQATPQLPQYPQPTPLPQKHQPLAPANAPPQLQPPPSHHPEESPYMPPPLQTYPPNICQPALPTQPPSGSATSQQLYGPVLHMYESSGGRASSEQPPFSAGYGLPSGPNFGDSYPYSGSSTHYNSSAKLPQLSSPSSPSGGSSYQRLPTAKILPQALPTATSVSGVSSSGGTANRVPIDDVVDKFATMGFSRDQVRATVRKLTENGQSVDLNVVLDKLMNEGEVQPQKGWFGQ